MAKSAGSFVRILSLACALLLAWLGLFAQTAMRATAGNSTQKTATGKSSSTTKSSKKRKGKHKLSWRRRGQQKIDSARASEIQQALIREHYLSGEPSGRWDQASQVAMERYQADNGWQTKTVPDSRALIKLGLGPNHDHLLNPESAMTSPIAKPSSNSRSTAAPAADPASTSQPQK
jgi:hypothetical protein